MQKIRNILNKDLSRRAFWVLVALVFALKAGLAGFQMVHTWIGGAPLDDELMFRLAQSISAGEWLGAYDYLTLSKSSFFAVWLAAVHAVGVNYLVAGQLLWCAAALSAALAFGPVLRKNWMRLALFALLAFNPAVSSAYSLRVYRDNIFPALCLFFFAGLAGYALRCTGKVSRAWGWLVLCGAGFGTAWLTREDAGTFLLPFALAGSIAVAVAVVCQKGLAQKALRLVLLAVPYGILAAAIGAVCSLNNAYYGVFALSDFSAGSFADAIGAMVRVEESDWQPLVSIPKEVRTELYGCVPRLQCLEKWLEEDEMFQNNFVNPAIGDYQSGSFYWAIRRAAQYEGIYDTPQKADAYWAGVAKEINLLFESEALPAECGPRSSTAPRIRAEYVLPTLAETARGFGYSAVFGGCAPYSALRTIGDAENIAVWEDYLHCKTNVAAVAGTDLPYYSPLQKLVYGAMNALRWVYAIALPLGLLAAAAAQVRRAAEMLKNKSTEGLLLWVLLLGLLGMALLRCAMIAFVEVASFNIGTSVMYLATVHPLLILYTVVGLWGRAGEEK